MIYSDEPSDWKDLETKVCQILLECGCQTEHSKHLTLPRGEVDIDVYARDIAREPNLIIVCECKQWGKPVSQTVVHAFRTVVAETGAHVGYVISSADLPQSAQGWALAPQGTSFSDRGSETGSGHHNCICLPTQSSAGPAEFFDPIPVVRQSTSPVPYP